MASELKPCPFCGSDARMWPSHTKVDKNGSYEIVGCSNIDCFIEPTTDEYLPFEEAVKRWNTRPAPAATDTGLVTKGYLFQTLTEKSGWLTKFSFTDPTQGGLPYRSVGKLCLQSQAEELLAAERAENGKLEAAWLKAEGIISDLESDNTAKDARIKELEEVYERLEQQAIKDRKLRNEAQSDADLWRFSVDMGDHPSLLVKVWKQRKALEAVNAAKEAEWRAAAKLGSEVNRNLAIRIREIEVDKAIYKERAETLEAKLAAAEKALEYFLVAYEEDYNLHGAAIEARAVLGGKPS